MLQNDLWSNSLYVYFFNNKKGVVAVVIFLMKGRFCRWNNSKAQKMSVLGNVETSLSAFKLPYFGFEQSQFAM